MKFLTTTILVLITFLSFANDYPINTIRDGNAINKINFTLHHQECSSENHTPTLPIKTDTTYSFFDTEINNNRLDLLAFSLKNSTSQNRLRIKLNYFTCFNAVLYEINNDGTLCQIGTPQGNDHPITSNNYIDFIYEIDLKSDSTKKYLIATNGKFPLIKYLVYTANDIAIIEHAQEKEIITFIYFAICLVMLLYNVFLSFSTRDRLYTFYVLFLLMNCITQLDIKGFTYKFYWEGNGFMSLNNFMFFLPLTMQSGTVFIRRFTNSKLLTPTLDSIYKYIPIIAVVSSIGVICINRNAFYFGIIISSSLWGWLSFLIAIFSYIRGNKSSLYVIIAQSVYQIGITIFVLAINGDIPNTMFTFYCLEIGSAIDLVFLSLSLADRINTLKQEKDYSQQQALKSERKYRQELVNRKVILEQQVEEQTAELRTTNFELKRQALSAQINPHFIFNVLNSIQSYILDDKKEEAEKYIAKFSRLMRFYLDSSVKPTISLKSEIEALERYLQLEQLRFDNSFSYTVHFDNLSSLSKTHMGSMLILPFVENAVWHGMRQIDYPGEIAIYIRVKTDQLLEIQIDDNGCGIEKSKEFKRKGHESNGIRITKERIHLLHSNIHIVPEIKIETGLTGVGTLVSFTIPYTINEE